ncbi:hypothetical protein [Streptomyces coelicoflavus]|uniref:hypothetical protein n=1 Tax=Streptomyces coelicoflavus TaxID=285562 RepID=UPI00131EE172
MRFRDAGQRARNSVCGSWSGASDGELPHLVVLARPRGGVPVAAEVARVLGAPWDVLVARKAGLPGQPETGIGGSWTTPRPCSTSGPLEGPV